MYFMKKLAFLTVLFGSMTIAAVCVSAQRVNVALNKAAIQSSDYDRNVYPASRAVNGNTTGTGNDFTHTKDGTGNWWQVDLGEVYDIDEIVVWNRVDACCWNRLQNFYVMVSENPITENDKKAFSGPSSFDKNFPNIKVVKRGKGRWIRIFTINGTMALSLAEVQVFGKPAGGAAAGVSDGPAATISVQANDIAFSPDGKTIASVGNDRTIKLWDVATGANTKTMSGHGGVAGLTSVAFSPDGKTLASGGGSGIKLWNVATGAVTKTLAEGLAGNWIDLAFSPDGKTLAVGGDSLTLWNIATGAKTKTFDSRNRRLAFSPDGKTIAATGIEIEIWDVASGVKKASFGRSKTGSAISVAISPDGKTVAGAEAYPGPIDLWNTANGANIKTLGTGDDFRNSLAFSPDGKTLASGGRQLKLWDVASGTSTKTLSGMSGTTTAGSIAFSRDGKMLASASTDNTIRLWRVK